MTQNIHINFSKFDSPLEIADYFHTEEICKAAIAQERLEKPRAFDPRGQATVTPRGKI